MADDPLDAMKARWSYIQGFLFPWMREDNDLTMYSGEKSNAAAGSSLAAYSQGDNSQHVNFIDDFGHVHELYRSPNPTAQWVDRAYPVNADAR